jgi:hypothetical protein
MPAFYETVAILREIVEVLGRRTSRVAFKSGEAVANIGRVADFAGLAVAYDIESTLGLAIYCVGDRPPHRFVEFSLVEIFAAVLREQEVNHFLRAGKAAHMGGENAIGTEFHLRSLNNYVQR